MEEVKEFDTIRINKNRGWRGLAELECYNSLHHVVNKMLFSFSEDVWQDMLRGYIVLEDNVYYHVITFNNIEKLPHGHQRSVLIKDFTAEVTNVNSYNKEKWREAPPSDWKLIANFINNNNRHTKSDWNCIGVRVKPSAII